MRYFLFVLLTFCSSGAFAQNDKQARSCNEKKKEMLANFRERVLNGDDFAMLAYMYSEDIKTAKMNGEVGWTKKRDLEKYYYKVASQLDKNEISVPFKTKGGWHIVQLLDKKCLRIPFLPAKCWKIKTRHILLICRTYE